MLNRLYEWDCGTFNTIEEIEKQKRRSWNCYLLSLISTTLLSIFSFEHFSYLSFAIIFGVLTTGFYLSVCFMELKLFLLKQKDERCKNC